jgi:hypothetical protein
MRKFLQIQQHKTNTLIQKKFLSNTKNIQKYVEFLVKIRAKWGKVVPWQKGAFFWHFGPPSKQRPRNGCKPGKGRPEAKKTTLARK